MIRNVVTRSSLLFAALLSGLSPLRAEEPDLREALRDALYAEEVDRDAEKAAAQYEALVSRHDAQRPFAASALFRLAEIRRKQGRQDEAAALYQRVIREFPQAAAEGRSAREALAGLGEKVEEAAAGRPSREAEELERFQRLAESSPDSFQQEFRMMLGATPGPSAALVEQVIALGADPLAEGVLPGAAGAARKDLCGLLLKLGKPSPREAGNALAAAIGNGHTQLLAFLLEQGLPAESPVGWRDEVSSPLFVAIEKRDRTAVDLLLKAGADPSRIVNPEWQPQQAAAECGTSLHKAVRWGDVDVKLVRMLLEAGADPKVSTPHAAITPLHLAVIRKQEMPPEAVKLLLDHGADPNARCTYRKVDYSNLPDRLADATPFLLAALENRIDLVERMLAKGADPDSVWGDGRPLLVSLLDDEKSLPLPLIQVLLEHGADPEKAGPEGVSALEVAVSRNRGDLVDLFLRGRKLRAEASPLVSAAVASDRWPLVEKLIDAGARPPEEVVAMLIRKRKWDLALQLLNAGAPLPPAGKQYPWETSLFEALEKPEGFEVAKKMIELGAKPDEGWARTGFETGDVPGSRGLRPGVRSYLFRTFQLPLLEATPDIRLAGHEWNGTRLTPLAAADRVQRPLAEMMLDHPPGELRWGHSVERGDVVTIWRKDGAGWKPAHEFTLEGDVEFPAAIAGDVVEVSPGNEARSGEPWSVGLTAPALWEIRRRVAFPVTLATAGGRREVMLRGDRLVYDPAQPAVVPFGSARQVARVSGILDVEPDGQDDPLEVMVRREGWPEVRIPYAPTTADVPLRPGDEVSVFSRTLSDARRQAIRSRRVSVTAPGSGWWRHFGWSGDRRTLPTLCQLVAEVTQQRGPATLPDDPGQAAVELVKLGWIGSYLSAPDLSAIRIRRWDEGAESVMEVNLLERAASLRADAPAGEIRALDVPLEFGDIVEIPSLPAGSAAVWDGPAGRLLEAAISCRVQLTIERGDVSVREVRYAPPQIVETAGGAATLPRPGSVCSVAADVVAASWKLTLTQLALERDEEPAGRDSLLEASSVFLRDGDRLFLPPAPGSPRVAPLPSPGR